MEQVNVGDGIRLTISPIVVGQIVRRLCATFSQVRRYINLNAELLWISRGTVREVGLRIRARNENASIRKKDGLRVVHARDDSRAEDGESRANRVVRVVQDCGEVRILSKTEPSLAMVRSV